MSQSDMKVDENGYTDWVVSTSGRSQSDSCSLYGQVFPAYTTRLNLRPLTSLSTPKDPTGRAVPLRGTGILASTAHAARGAVL